MVGGLSVSRMIIGTNWFLGWSHQSPAKDHLIKSKMDRKAIADVLGGLFPVRGVDTIMGPLAQNPSIFDAIEDAEDRTGAKCIKVDTPIITFKIPMPVETRQRLFWTRWQLVALKSVCLTIPQLNGCWIEALSEIRRLGEYTNMIRERGMIPGLSAHMPEVLAYADQNDMMWKPISRFITAWDFWMQIEVEGYIN